LVTVVWTFRVFNSRPPLEGEREIPQDLRLVSGTGLSQLVLHLSMPVAVKAAICDKGNMSIRLHLQLSLL
jgi:hypothetical protein